MFKRNFAVDLYKANRNPCKFIFASSLKCLLGLNRDFVQYQYHLH